MLPSMKPSHSILLLGGKQGGKTEDGIAEEDVCIYTHAAILIFPKLQGSHTTDIKGEARLSKDRQHGNQEAAADSIRPGGFDSG
jgi:hypothetical protein